jgi:hypothetical protein
MASATQDEVLIDTCSSDNEISLKLLLLHRTKSLRRRS